MGFKEIVGEEGKNSGDVFNFVNTPPGENVAAVITEEAMFISFGILNALRHG
jgi:predicted SPOUT superfamily RNA methylase MTH1